MTYLKTFQIPSDLWVCWYFHPWFTQGDPPSPPPHDMPDDLISKHPNHCSYHNTWYPWNVFENRFIPSNVHDISNISCPQITFSDLTVFYGGNGSGKSTLLNVIADKMQSERTAPHNTSPFFNDYVSQCDYRLDRQFQIEGNALKSKIITSDEIFMHLLSLRENNAQINEDREILRKEYYQRPTGRKTTLSRYINHRIGRTNIEKSNGETAFNYYFESIKEDYLILLDEPENSLSAMWQKDLALLLRGAMRNSRCQFIIATHSPFFLSIPHAKIYNLDESPIKEAKWNELESMQCYYNLFEEYKRLFE